MRPWHTDLGRHTLVGRVTTTRYQRYRQPRRGPYVVTSVWVPTPGPMPDGSLRRPWMIQSPVRPWPAAARCDGHDVRVTATLGAPPNGIGATAYRAVVVCADEAEHTMAALVAM